jgi:hypothetical protein
MMGRLSAGFPERLLQLDHGRDTEGSTSNTSEVGRYLTLNFLIRDLWRDTHLRTNQPGTCHPLSRLLLRVNLQD